VLHYGENRQLSSNKLRSSNQNRKVTVLHSSPTFSRSLQVPQLSKKFLTFNPYPANVENMVSS